VRPLSSAALARAREEARRRTEEAVRRWERRLEERVDAVVARAVDRACEESLGRGVNAAGPNADDPVLLAVGGSVRAALREAVEAHAATLVDDVRDAASEDEDARFLDVDSAYAYAETTPETTPGKPADLGRDRLLAFLAEEAARRARLRETVEHLHEQLREKEAEARLREARNPGSERRLETRVESRANESEATVAAVASLAAAEAAASSNENVKAPDAARVPVPSFRDLDLRDAVRGARVAARRVTNTPAFELAWPLLLVAALLRAQIGPDAFAWSSVF
jgi:hypothetical protein